MTQDGARGVGQHRAITSDRTGKEIVDDDRRYGRNEADRGRKQGFSDPGSDNREVCRV